MNGTNGTNGTNEREIAVLADARHAVLMGEIEREVSARRAARGARKAKRLRMPHTDTLGAIIWRDLEERAERKAQARREATRRAYWRRVAVTLSIGAVAAFASAGVVVLAAAPLGAAFVAFIVR